MVDWSEPGALAGTDVFELEDPRDTWAASADEDDIPMGSWTETELSEPSGESQRQVSILDDLALQLAEAGYSDEALRAAGANTDPYRAARAHLALVPHLPEPYREQAQQQARDALLSVANEEQRIGLLVTLAVQLPPGLQEAALRQALTELGEIKSEYRRTRLLGEVASELPAEFLSEALAIARAIRDVDHLVATLIGLAPYLPAGLVDPGDSLSLVDSIASEYRRTQGLADLAPHLSEPLLRLAVERAAKLGSSHWRHRALAALLPHMAALGRGDEALLQVGTIAEEQCQADALVGLAPHLPESLLPEARRLAEAIRGETWRTRAVRALDLARPASRRVASAPAVSGPVAGGVPGSQLLADLDRVCLVEREFERARALAELAQPLSGLAPEQLLPHWQETLHLLASRPRRDLLADLRALQPVVVGLGGATAVAEAYQAVEDVGLWWP
jgi:hypothetical protein